LIRNYVLPGAPLSRREELAGHASFRGFARFVRQAPE
jgi:hypothetical protein